MNNLIVILLSVMIYVGISLKLRTVMENSWVLLIKIILNISIVCVILYSYVTSVQLKPEEFSHVVILGLLIVNVYLVIEYFTKVIRKQRIMLIPFLLTSIMTLLFFVGTNVTKGSTIEGNARAGYDVLTIDDKKSSFIYNNVLLDFNVEKSLPTSEGKPVVHVSGTTNPESKVLIDVKTDKGNEIIVVDSNKEGVFDRYIEVEKFGKVDIEIHTRNIKYEHDNYVVLNNDISDGKKSIDLKPSQTFKEGEYLVSNESEIKPGVYIVDSKDSGNLYFYDTGYNIDIEGNLYVQLYEGEHVWLENAYLINSENIDYAIPQEKDNSMLKVGKDIDKGKYKIQRKSDESIIKMYNDSLSSSYTGDLVYEEIIELYEGQYIFSHQIELEKI